VTSSTYGVERNAQSDVDGNENHTGYGVQRQMRELMRERDAERRGRRSDPDDVKIEVTETSDGVMICARYPRPNGSLNDCEGDSKVRNNDVEVKFTLRVPAGVHVAAQTVNGGIQLIGLRGDAKANTVNGSVRVSTSGTAEASTVNGGITVDVGDAQLGHDLSFNTVNGGVDVMLPANVNADVRASTTNGTIDTDFPVSIQGRWGPRTMSGTLGKGGSNLSMTTVNGSIHLRSKRRTIRSL
jgi:DUF4097 and DUF4098 domain-containing protein YvlB